MSNRGVAAPIIRFDNRALQLSALERFQAALFISVLLHGTFLFGTYLKMPDPRQFKGNQSALDVVLVNSKSRERPIDPKVRAQANLDGGGNSDEKRRAKNPLPSQHDETTQLEQSTARASRAAQQAASETARLITAPHDPQRADHQAAAQQSDASNPSRSTSGNESSENSEPNPLPSTLATRVLQRVRQISRLEAEIAKEWSAYQQRPKRQFVGARAAEYRFAGYVEEWRTRIEKIGNENYPEAARQNNLYGSLLITVAIRSDGSVENIEILRSSGNKILDAAAIHIIELAAPFGGFPLELREDTDVLHITRTWTYTRANQLLSE
ncbi:MAG: TonB family protein [Burkholderiales bacterium]